MCLQTHTLTYSLTHKHSCTHEYAFTQTHTLRHIHIHAQVHTFHGHTHTRTHTSTNTNTHKHARTHSPTNIYKDTPACRHMDTSYKQTHTQTSRLTRTQMAGKTRTFRGASRALPFFKSSPAPSFRNTKHGDVLGTPRGELRARVNENR